MTRHLRWWKEAIYVLAFYLVYSWIRNQFGSASVSYEQAFDNAKEMIQVERWVGLYHEETLQDWFLDDRWFIQFWNLFYGTFHFVVTTFCIFWLFIKFKDRYIKFRTTLAVTTALALIGFATYPLLPPRLLPASYGFVDTLRDYGGLWSFDSGTMQKISNQYAAMPSLHFGWSTWCALVLVPTVRRRWLKVLCALYPVATLFAIMVTANHYWIDAAGGALILGAGFAVGTWWSKRMEARHDDSPAAIAETSPPGTAEGLEPAARSRADAGNAER